MDSIFYLELLNENPDAKRIFDFEESISNNNMDSNVVSEFLKNILSTNVAAKNRIQFYFLYEFIKRLGLKVYSANELLSLCNPNILPQIQLILWLLEKTDYYEYSIYSKDFILLLPEHQSEFLKRTFFLAYKGEITINLEMLDELIRIDDNLFNLINKYKPGLIIDISSHVVIESLKSLRNNNRFLDKNEILMIATKYLTDKKYHFQIKDYFIGCEGRYTYDRDIINGVVKKVMLDDNAVEFHVQLFTRAELFHEIKDAIKSLPGRRWDPSINVWRIPYFTKNELKEISKKYLMYLKLDLPYDEENKELFARGNQPSRLLYCQAGTAMIDDITEREGFWCEGKPCFELSHSIFQKTQSWSDISLLDICKTLGLETDKVKNGEIIKDGKYYEYAGQINAFNRLLDKLYCKECKSILNIYKNPWIASHNYNYFYCSNPNCREHISSIEDVNYEDSRMIYLNNCHNGCGNIVDSRESQRCPNNFVICDKCGHCCSNKLFSRIITNYEIASKPLPKSLQNLINNNLGHNDHSITNDDGTLTNRPEFYCFKDGEQMSLSDRQTKEYECWRCKTKYYTKEKRIKVGFATDSTGQEGIDELYAPPFIMRYEDLNQFQKISESEKRNFMDDLDETEYQPLDAKRSKDKSSDDWLELFI